MSDDDSQAVPSNESRAAPAPPLFGHQTELAVANFGVSGEAVPRSVIEALLRIKSAAAHVNARHSAQTGVDASTAAAIDAAVRELLADHDPSQFPVDVFQTGSGTSTNMNVNEVIATLATRHLGTPVHPNDHVNASQSTNDTFPSAIRIAALGALNDDLLPGLARLDAALADASQRFAGVVKAGRTHLMDATPITLGQEFGGYRRQVVDGIDRLRGGLGRLGQLPIGGTATGNGLNAPVGFGAEVVERLVADTGLALTEAPEHFSVQGSQDALVELSADLRGAAIAVFKIANDLRLMASGPRTGLGEIRLPSLQPGSSIMPGKVNPVICEVVTQVAAQVVGHDATVAFAGSQGALELNAYLPVMARNVLAAIDLLARAVEVFVDRCIAGIEADEEQCRAHAEATPAIGAALNTHLGYDVATEVVTESLRRGRTIREVVLDRGLMSADALDAVLDLDAMARGTVPPS